MQLGQLVITRLPGSLYQHQLKALALLRTGSILRGGVGSGKSRTAIAYYLSVVTDFGSKEVPLVIITTAAKRNTGDWQEEAELFSLEDVIVDSWNNIKKYSDHRDCFFIFDEQRLVGSGTWVKHFLKIARRNEWILLSATPGDTWSDYIPVFLANGFYKTRSDFFREHAVFSRFTKYPKIERYIETAKLERLKHQITVEMEFLKKSEIFKTKIDCAYNKDRYTRVFKDRWNIYDDRPIEESGELYYLVRRVVNEDLSRIREAERLALLHPRMIIFYNFNYELDLLLNMLLIPSTIITQYNGHRHDALPDSERWIHLVQYMSGAEGWNCTATNITVFYSYNYSWKMMEQAAGRIDRMNSPFSKLYYYYLTSKSPIDVAIERCLEDKRDFNTFRFPKIGETR